MDNPDKKAFIFGEKYKMFLRTIIEEHQDKETAHAVFMYGVENHFIDEDLWADFYKMIEQLAPHQRENTGDLMHMMDSFATDVWQFDGNVDVSIMVAREMVKIKPDLASVQACLASFFYVAGEYEQAEEEMQRALDIEDNVDVRLRFGKILSDHALTSANVEPEQAYDMLEKAKKHFLKGVERGFPYRELTLKQAQGFEEQGDISKAHDYRDYASHIQSLNYMCLKNLAMTYLALEEEEEAEKTLRAFLDYVPHDQEAVAALEELLESQGRGPQGQYYVDDNGNIAIKPEDPSPGM